MKEIFLLYIYYYSFLSLHCSLFAGFEIMLINFYVCEDGFHKVLSDQGGLIKDGKKSVQFGHTHFRRGHHEDLYLVQRKVRLEEAGIRLG